MTDPITRNEVRDELKDSERRIEKMLELHLAPLRDDVERNSHAIFGNGGAGLLTRMEVAEEKQSRFALGHTVVTLVAAVAAALVGRTHS